MKLVAAALVLIPSLAFANGHAVTAGVGLGVQQDEAQADADPNTTMNLWGRLQMIGRVSGQLELARVGTQDGSGVDIRSMTGVAVVDLGRSHLMPMVLAGLGADHVDTAYTSEEYIHAFLGFGLEYRAANGFVFGGDFRIGNRSSTEPQYKAQPVTDVQAGQTARLAPSDHDEGQYRAFRLTMGIRF